MYWYAWSRKLRNHIFRMTSLPHGLQQSRSASGVASISASTWASSASTRSNRDGSRAGGFAGTHAGAPGHENRASSGVLKNAHFDSPHWVHSGGSLALT